jgi:hypothetical protein
MTPEAIAQTVAALKTARRGEPARLMRQMAAEALPDRDYARWKVLKAFTPRKQKKRR